MLVFPALCAATALAVWWVHTFLGEKHVAAAMRRADFHPFAKTTIEACWHFATFALAMIALGAAWAASATMDARARVWVLSAIVLSTGVFALLFLLLGKLRFDRWTRMPQAPMLAAIAVTAALGLGSSFSMPARAGFSAFLALACLGLAVLHIVWALGAVWPARTRADLTELMVGLPARADGEAHVDRFPSRAATLAVAASLTICATWLSLAVFVPRHTPLADILPLVLAAVFGLRGVLGYFDTRLRPATRSLPFAHWNRVLYSPLCLLLAALSWGAAG
jgi:hypothetical protein